MTKLELPNLKEALRAHYLERRKSLSSEEWSTLNSKLVRQALDLKFDDVSCAHVFLPIQKQREPDTLSLVQALNHRSDIQLDWVISKTVRSTGELYHFLWDDRTILRENNWGIPEPIGGLQVPDDNIDLVFIPLLVFDLLGHRIGYGKGYYDRFLAKCRPDTFKIGISLFEPIQQILDVYESDVLMDACLTPTQIYRFTDRGFEI